MVFENIATMLESINFLNTGIYFLIVGMMFAIARGITKDKEEMLGFFIILGAFGTILMFSQDYIKSFLFVTTAILIIVYSIKYLKSMSNSSS